MSYTEWSRAPLWRKCVILHDLGMSWREMSLLCGVTTSRLRRAVDSRRTAPWMAAVGDIPIPSREEPAPGWADKANCRGLPYDWFETKVGNPVADAARRACAECQVAQPCLDEVLLHVDDVTYRAFTTPRVRRGYRLFFLQTETADDSTQPPRTA